jgi:hypothetical protein
MKSSEEVMAVDNLPLSPATYLRFRTHKKPLESANTRIALISSGANPFPDAETPRLLEEDRRLYPAPDGGVVVPLGFLDTARLLSRLMPWLEAVPENMEWQGIVNLWPHGFAFFGSGVGQVHNYMIQDHRGEAPERHRAVFVLGETEVALWRSRLAEHGRAVGL